MITILTPTYNRAHTLPKLFDSLMKQRVLDFEWLVIDDGSCDSSVELINDFGGQAPFTVRYMRKENGGKHTALNKGIQEARGEWILIVDSDDFLIPTALDVVSDAIASLGESGAVGICFRTKFPSGQVNGMEVDTDDRLKMNPTEASHFFGGDLAYVFRRSVMLRNSFPVVPGENFVPELYIWNKISDYGPIIYFPRTVIYICEYLEDGYSRNFKRNLRRNPRGFGLHYKAQVAREENWLMKTKCFIRYLQCKWYQLRACV